MKSLVILFLLALSPLSATYLFLGTETCNYNQKKRLFDLIIKAEPPRAFYEVNPIDLEAECHKLTPSIHLEWIPSSLWQVGVLHAFFHNPMIREGILTCCGSGWEPLQYEESLRQSLISAASLENVVNGFDQHSQRQPTLCDLFFETNQALISLYERADYSETKMLQITLAELPSFCEWREKKFPFWQSPWIYNPQSPAIFYQAVKDHTLFVDILKIERLAHEKGEWVLYRGYPGSRLPSTIQLNTTESHALSFGSTLLGGVFFSLESCAMTYSKSDSAKVHSFLALRVKPQELKELFRVGPLHPFIQMLADGEMFHAHTKIATKHHIFHESNPLEGYFMKCNKHYNDPIGYITNPNMTPEELEQIFLLLCKKAGHIFLYDPEKPL